MTRIFVYGTLKSDHFRNPTYLGGEKFIGPATIEGFDLFSIRSMFPAVVRPIDGPGVMVKGEVYEVGDRTLEALDRLESNGSMYTREIVETSLGPAWVYVMSREEAHEYLYFGGIEKIGDSWEQSHYGSRSYA